ncbi:MAG: acyltransferase [Spirochaetae bacterium HGW-Spirochaetae-5]|nr:MAG: acyltransferase [Spirochaetae bacterium HGW-Spirochaetae-5]
MNTTESIITSDKSLKKISFLKLFFYNLTGVFSVLFILTNTIIGYPFLLAASIIKLIPLKPLQKICTRILIMIATAWIHNNTFLCRRILGIKVNVTGDTDLPMKEWYLVISNHQSWSDIVVLQIIFNGKIPLLKFFLKKELIWIPLLGIAWWALDFPFMKRYTAEFIARHPHLKGKDIEITKKACAKFSTTPVSVMNFVEGTRFTKHKHDRQKSPFKNLLKPKAGGTGFVFTAMGQQLHSILNVTIKYPQGDLNFWNFVCGRINRVNVLIKKIPVTPDLIGDYVSDPVYQKHFQNWLNDLWIEKDKTFEQM